MDALVKHWDAVEDGELNICSHRGLAYQRSVAPYNYGDSYFDNYASLEGKEIAIKINKARVGLVGRHAGSKARVLDVGIGSGEFIKNRPNTYGTDVCRKAVDWLVSQHLYASNLEDFQAFTFWDVIEHVPIPNGYFKHVPRDSFLFVSIPTFPDLTKVRASKHYKPNEHLYYWTEKGFVDWMAEYQFRLLEKNHDEVEAGREGITSFAFKRDLPTYHDTLEQYKIIHSKAYGTTAYMYFDDIAGLVKNLNPESVLDFGCGRSDLAAHFWNEGRRRIEKYDPAIPQFKRMPPGQFGLVLCCDVMEHIPQVNIQSILSEIRAKSAFAIFTISMRPARAKLPDGRNAHVTLLTSEEWLRWIKTVFGRVRRVPLGADKDDHLLMAVTF